MSEQHDRLTIKRFFLDKGFFNQKRTNSLVASQLHVL